MPKDKVEWGFEDRKIQPPDTRVSNGSEAAIVGPHYAWLSVILLTATLLLPGCQPSPAPGHPPLICDETVVPVRVGDTSWTLLASETKFGSGVKRARDGRVCRSSGETLTPERFWLDGLPGEAGADVTTLAVGSSEDPMAMTRRVQELRGAATDVVRNPTFVTFSTSGSRYFVFDNGEAQQVDVVACSLTGFTVPLTGERRHRCSSTKPLSAEVGARIVFFVAEISEESVRPHILAATDFISSHMIST